MHIYIYDSFLQSKKYEKVLARLETRITDLGLSGKILRPGLMKNLASLVQTELKRGAKTIVAVGNDQTVFETVNALVGWDVPLGIIPIEKNNSIAQSLGIESVDSACDIIAARRIETIDVGVVGQKYFLSYLTIPSKNTVISVDDSYILKVRKEGKILIVNLPSASLGLPDNNLVNPQDGILQVFILTKQNKKILFSTQTKDSLFSFSDFNIANKKHPLKIEGIIKASTPTQISIKPSCLKVIVGKNRVF